MYLTKKSLILTNLKNRTMPTESILIGVMGAVGGALMAIKNKLTLFMVIFSGVTGWFMATMSTLVVSKFFPDAGGDIKYALGFFFGMASYFLIDRYDILLNTLLTKWTSKMTGKIPVTIEENIQSEEDEK